MNSQEDNKTVQEKSSTPNLTQEVPHLTDAEIAAAHKMNNIQKMMLNHQNFLMFQKLRRKPERINKPLAINEKGDIVKVVGIPALIEKGNVRKGTLLNRKCSCGSGKKYKKCCLKNN